MSLLSPLQLLLSLEQLAVSLVGVVFPNTEPFPVSFELCDPRLQSLNCFVGFLQSLVLHGKFSLSVLEYYIKIKPSLIRE